MPVTNRYRRLWFYGSNTIISSLVFMAILGFVVLIVEKHPWRKDLTESGKFSLSQQTRSILGSIHEPVTIKAFFASTEQDRTRAQDLLETFRYYNNRLSFEFIDLNLRPELARQYEVRTDGTLVLEGYGKQSIQKADEESITNALFKLSRKQEKKLYFLIGHGERSIDDSGKGGYATLQGALEKENYQIGELNLLRQDKVSEDAAVVVVAGPQKPLMDNEIASLDQYLKNGGKLLVLLDPYRDGGLKELARSYGIELYDDEVIDKLSQVLGGNYLMPVVTQYELHKITDGFRILTFYPEARTVRPAKQEPQGVQVMTLASTSEGSWAEMDREMLKKGQASFDEQVDMAGPVPIVALAEIDNTDAAKKKQEPVAPSEPAPDTPDDQNEPSSGKSFLVVIGNSAFVDNTYFGFHGNGDLFLNIVNFLAEEESLITLERREKKGQPMVLTQGQERLVFWMSLVLVPCIILMVGAGVYRVRRSQR